MKDDAANGTPVAVAKGRMALLPAFALMTLLCAVPSRAPAITITANFVAPGSTFANGTTAGSAPTTNTAGGGDLTTIFNTAASYWQNALTGSGSFTVNYGWAPLSGSTLAATFTSSNGSTAPFIEFDNDGSSAWFLDSTPTTNSDYGSFSSSSADLGGGVVNTGRVFGAASGAAANRFDLLSAAAHELGHALGFLPSSSTTSITIKNPLPNAGTVIPTTSDGHINISTALMSPTLAPGQRKFASGVDILGVAQLGGYRSVDLNPTPVPLPGGLLLMGSGLAALTTMGRRRRAA